MFNFRLPYLQERNKNVRLSVQMAKTPSSHWFPVDPA